MLDKEDYGQPSETPLGRDIGSYNLLTVYDRFSVGGRNLQGPIMKTLKRRLLEIEVELLVHRREADTFEEEKLINHVTYAVKELVDFLEKRDGGSSS